jgi:hypothetical protein
MSQQDLTFLRGQDFNTDLERRIERIVDVYCRRIRERWGIEMIPKISWDEKQGFLSLGAEPASPLDEAMLCKVMMNEGLPPC